MNTENTNQKSVVPFGNKGVELASLEDAFRFATAVSKSGFAPKGIETPEAILIAVQFGAELGLTPMAALQSLAIINGRPAVYGDAALALVRGSGELESYTQTTNGEGDALKAVVRVKRKGFDEVVSEFSVNDAKKASLWGKAGPWSQYPARMLMWRARGFALRDAFGDVLRGLRTTEEAEDMPEIKNVTPVPRAKVPQVEKPVAIEAPTVVEAIASGDPEIPANKLERLLKDAGVTFEQIKPVIQPNKLCARDAKSIDDMTDSNIYKVISDIDIIVSAAKAEGEV